MGRVGVPGCTSPQGAGGTGLRAQAGVTEAGGDLAIPHRVPTDRWGWPGTERMAEMHASAVSLVPEKVRVRTHCEHRVRGGPGWAGGGPGVLPIRLPVDPGPLNRGSRAST